MANVFRVDGKFSLWRLIISILVSEGVGALSAIFTRNAGQFYHSLQLPPFAPPSWVFGPVWIILYFLMGLASYRIWMYGLEKREVRQALILYLIQLCFNFLWSVIFFGFNLIGIAFLEILVLYIFILLTTHRFYKIDRLAGDLMFPYILWVAFAAFLNFSIWRINR